MTHQHEPAQDPQDRNLHKRFREYNLEKDPQQTGIDDPVASLREKAATGGDFQTTDRRMHGTLSAFLIALLVILSGVAGWYIWKFFSAAYSIE